MAETAGITLVAVARADGFEIFTHPERIAACAGWRDHKTSEQNSVRERIHVG
jgi:FdhD protein